MEQVKGTIESISQKTTSTNKTMYTINVGVGSQYPVGLKTMTKPPVEDGEHTFWYNLGDPYTNKHGNTVQTKWLQSIDELPQNMSVPSPKSQTQHIEPPQDELFKLVKENNTMLKEMNAPVGVDSTVKVEDIPF